MISKETILVIDDGKNIPIIFVTAKSEDIDIIQGLSVGADDYITKPFNPMELVARVKSNLRRYLALQGYRPSESNDKMALDELTIHFKTHEVTVGDKEIKLTRREFAILELLARNKGIVLSIEQIYERVWNEPFLGSENTVMVHIRKLREKIEPNPKEPKYIKTIRCVGYKPENK